MRTFRANFWSMVGNLLHALSRRSEALAKHADRRMMRILFPGVMRVMEQDEQHLN